MTTEIAPEQRAEWQRRLDELTKEQEGTWVTIEVLDPVYGDQTEAERMPFAYATYDVKDDVVIIAVGGNSPRFPVVLRHMIWHPREVDVTSGADLTAMKVTDADATETLVSFHQ
ncbi:MAG: hypothetical protein QOC80_2358 [Frankiaceae bacterium]|jgi:hypothetical protein|nr:hypothetical protein [Frankiaceae bacterium]